MDLNEICGVWTQEKHSAFLSRIEESFGLWMPILERIVGAVDGGEIDCCGVGLRLDRVLPDSASESNRKHIKKSKIKKI